MLEWSNSMRMQEGRAQAEIFNDTATLLHGDGYGQERYGTASLAGNIFDVCQYLSQAILLEVCVHPKPGMVTRFSNGSHHDMSLLTFAMSSTILIKAFYDLQQIGTSFTGAPENLLIVVRKYGIEAERQLLQVTKGVNTQRGILFSGGILSAAAGYMKAQGDTDDLLKIVQKMTKGLVRRELKRIDKDHLTAGEKLFCDYGIVGIRGEVESGFPSVIEYGLPALEEAFVRGANLNDALVHSLMALMTIVEDSNVIWRTNLAMARKVRKIAHAILSAGSIFTATGRAGLSAAEKYFIRHRISPGGSADLLSITIALYLLKHGSFPVQLM